MKKHVSSSSSSPEYLVVRGSEEPPPRILPHQVAGGISVDSSVVDPYPVGSGSGWIRNFFLDPDPELFFRNPIQQKLKEQINEKKIF